MYNLGQYVAIQSPVHSRDPRTKIITVIAFSIIIIQVNSIGLLVAASMVIAVSQLAHLTPGSLLKTLYPVLPFFLGLFLLYVFFTPGSPLPCFPIGPVHITYQGLYLGISQVGKFLLLVLAASVLTMTTTQSDITKGLERLLRPIRIIGISSHNIAMMVSLALRFVPALVDEMNSISEAQLARCANFNPHRLSGKIRAISYLAAPLSINIFRRCDELVDAMEARGYQQGSRTYLRELALDHTDYCIIGTNIVLLIGILLGHVTT
ncbi:hypothetical protein ASZ90_019207 [hydrocarbon metagenome]|uniref:Energy-coupling factor transporter transmembrane protein EcfT n=1 Tax=hydrocarbon metagenome TaxID=938273 RepID=A0A0W8E469_9ZZZZ